MGHHLAEVLEEALADGVVAAQSYQLERVRVFQVHLAVVNFYVVKVGFVRIQNVLFQLAQLRRGHIAQAAPVAQMGGHVSVQVCVKAELLPASRARELL